MSFNVQGFPKDILRLILVELVTEHPTCLAAVTRVCKLWHELIMTETFFAQLCQNAGLEELDTAESWQRLWEDTLVPLPYLTDEQFAEWAAPLPHRAMVPIINAVKRAGSEQTVFFAFSLNVTKLMRDRFAMPNRPEWIKKRRFKPLVVHVGFHTTPSGYWLIDLGFLRRKGSHVTTSDIYSFLFKSLQQGRVHGFDSQDILKLTAQCVRDMKYFEPLQPKNE
jgi:hypothetical protein